MATEDEKKKRAAEKAAYFVPENKTGEREVFSPSGKYKLVITNFHTKPVLWSFTQGEVFKKDSDVPIATVRRNYSAFPYSFVEDHPSGHDFLVAGEDYQGQTVVDLTTGERRDTLSDGTDKGFGFCWSEHRFHKESGILSVCGCHWACPYEFRFYDFSDPMRGWPEIEWKDVDEERSTGIFEDIRWPSIETRDETTLVRVFQTEHPESGGALPEDSSELGRDDVDGDGDKLGPIAAYTVLRRDGARLSLVEEWVSNREKEIRRKSEESNRKYEAWMSDFRKNDPLYLACVDLLAKNSFFNASDYDSVGIVHDDWCPHYKSEGMKEKRWCRRIAEKVSYSFNLEWAVEKGPIKLVIYKDGKHLVDEFFEHSVLGMTAAFEKAASLIGERIAQ